MLERDHGIGAFKVEDVADGQLPPPLDLLLVLVLLLVLESL
jgi:hypothetical protein